MGSQGASGAHYADTAFAGHRHEELPAGRDMEAMGYFQRASFGTRLPLLGPQCREYIAAYDYVGRLSGLRRTTEQQRQEQPDYREGYYQRRWASRADPLVIFALIGHVAGFFSFSPVAFALLMLLVEMGFTDTFFEVARISGAFFLGLISIWFLARVLVNSGWFGLKRDARFQRCTGMVSLWAGREVGRLELPFEEFEAFAAPISTAVGTYRYRLVLVHRTTDYTVAYPGAQLEVWETQLVWEELQQFMDVREPLPDIPELEDVRHRDPVTAVHDRETGRPERYWLTLSRDRVSELHHQARRFAAAYPWGFTREQALAAGWRPSGVGEGEWRKAESA